MFAADAAAGIEAELQDGRPEGGHPLIHPRLIRAVKDQRVEVAVTGMEDVGHRQAVLLTQTLNRGEDPGQGRAWHHSVLEVVVGELTAQG